MSLASTHSVAVSASHYTTTEAVQIKLPGKTLSLLTASSVAKFLVGTTLTTFIGSDPEFGSLGSLGQVGLSMDASSPVWKFSIMPSSPAALASLVSPAAQGSVVQYWTLVMDPATGAVVNAHRLWKGKIDTQVASLTASGMRVDIDVLTPTELLMAESEGERLTTAWQQLHFPGQKGLANNVEAMEQPFWGTDRTTNPTGGYSGGGGYAGGGWSGIIDMINQQQM